jgi:hypothetical protein
MRACGPVLVLASVVSSLAAAGCNAVLGIGEASPEPAPGDDGAVTDDGGMDGPEPNTCNHYCDVIMQNCQGANQEYLSRDICMAMCPVFELGAISDSLTDTLGCRIWHANAAGPAPQIHCPHAGPLGGQHCGDQCEAFCNLDTSYCTGTNSAYDGGEPTCLAACPKYMYVIALDAGDLTSTAGNTLNCRIWHLESAYTSSMAAQYHCPHTSEHSDMCL